MLPSVALAGKWRHYVGSGKEDGARVSVFEYKSQGESDPNLHAARNGLKRLRQVRHPNVLKLLDGVE